MLSKNKVRLEIQRIIEIVIMSYILNEAKITRVSRLLFSNCRYMRFLHIDPENYNVSSDGKNPIDELNQHIQDDKDIVLLIYKEGCPPCMQTRPEWKKLETNSEMQNKDVVIVDIDHTLQNKIKHLDEQTIGGYPTIRHVKGSKFEEFEDWHNKGKKRDIDSFVKWINYKLPKRGGYKRRYNRRTKKKRLNQKRRKTKRIK
jgi:hypothetical protein